MDSLKKKVLNKNENTNILNPWYVTGISDGEGSFQITLQNIKEDRYKPFLEFKVTQNKHSIDMLLGLQKFFNSGRINIDNRRTSTLKFVITKNDDIIEKLIPHFDKYPLITSKFLNYSDFRTAAFLMRDNKHKTPEGLKDLFHLKSKMNKVRSFKEKFDFCWDHDILLTPNWVEGFIDGEGSFQCEINFSKIRFNPQVNFILQIQQSNHDVAILHAIKEYFQSGYLKPKYDVRNFEDALNKSRKVTALWIRDYELICNFIDLYPLYTQKRLDYLDWKQLISLKKENMHLSEEGLKLIQRIRTNMNAKRTYK